MKRLAPVQSSRKTTSKTGDPLDSFRLAPFIFSAIFVLSFVLPIFANEPLPELRRKADAAHGGECAKLCLEAASALVEQSNALLNKGDLAAAQSGIQDAMAYARRGTDESILSKKRRKETEISLRKLERRLSDIAHTLDLEQQTLLKNDIDTLDKMRSRLLTSMFDLKAEAP